MIVVGSHGERPAEGRGPRLDAAQADPAQLRAGARRPRRSQRALLPGSHVFVWETAQPGRCGMSRHAWTARGRGVRRCDRRGGDRDVGVVGRAPARAAGPPSKPHERRRDHERRPDGRAAAGARARPDADRPAGHDVRAQLRRLSALLSVARSTTSPGSTRTTTACSGNKPPEKGGYYKLDSTNTLPVWMSARATRTAHFGKYLNGYGTRNPARCRSGWQNWQGAVNPTTYNYLRYCLNENGTLTSARDERGDPKACPGAVQRPAQYQTDLYTAKAVDYIDTMAPNVAAVLPVGRLPRLARRRAQPAERPLPCSASPPRDTAARLRRAILPRPPGFNEPDVSDNRRSIRRLPPSAARRSRTSRRLRCRREALLAVDDGVQRIMDALQRLASSATRWSSSSSDNGFFQGEHRVPRGKIKVYEPSTRVPAASTSRRRSSTWRAPRPAACSTASRCARSPNGPRQFAAPPRARDRPGERPGQKTRSTALRTGRWNASSTSPARASSTTCAPTRSSAATSTRSSARPRRAWRLSWPGCAPAPERPAASASAGVEIEEAMAAARLRPRPTAPSPILGSGHAGRALRARALGAEPPPDEPVALPCARARRHWPALKAAAEALDAGSGAKLDRAPTLVVVSVTQAGDPVADEEDALAERVAEASLLLAGRARPRRLLRARRACSGCRGRAGGARHRRQRARARLAAPRPWAPGAAHPGPLACVGGRELSRLTQ